MSGVKSTGLTSRESVTRGPWKGLIIENRTDMDVEMQWECEIDNNPIFDNRQPKCTDITGGRNPRTVKPPR